MTCCDSVPGARAFLSFGGGLFSAPRLAVETSALAALSSANSSQNGRNTPAADFIVQLDGSNILVQRTIKNKSSS